MQQAKEIIGRCRKNLLQSKQHTHAVLQNPTVKDWLRLDIKTLLADGKPFGVGEELREPLKKFNELAAAIQNRIEVVDNEVGSLSADLTLSTTNADSLIGAAEQAEKSCIGLAGEVETLLAFEKSITDADSSLRQSLSLKNLIRSVADQSGGSADFELGRRVLRVTSDDPSLGSETVNLRQLFVQANSLADRLHGVELPEKLPAVVRSAILNRIATVTEALEDIKNYVDFVEAQVSDLHSAINSLQQSLVALRNEPAGIILQQLGERGKRCSTLVSAFKKYARVVDGAEKIGILLHDVKSFGLALQSPQIQAFFQKASKAGSALHPSAYAKRLAEGYFRGLTGLLRMLRLLLQTLARQRLLSESALQQLLESAILQFTPQGGDKKQLERSLAEICQNLLSPYSSPFPHDDLVRLVRKAVADYSASIETHLTLMEIPLQASENEACHQNAEIEAPQPSPCPSLGKLLSRIEVRAANLKDFV